MCMSQYTIGNVKAGTSRKGRTKRQLECLALRPKLDKCWRSKIRGARELFQVRGWYSRKRSLVWCEACGQIHHQEFPEMGTRLCLNENEYVCPHCGAHLILEETDVWSSLPKYDASQYAYVTHINNWTVVRVFYVERRVAMEQKQKFDVHEVWQRWIDENGVEVILSKKYYRSPFYFNWNFESDWKIGRHNGGCSGYYVSSDVYDLYGMDFGEIDVAPILKRNGWHDGLRSLRVDMVEVWKKMLKEPMAEELVKSGQESVLAYWISYDNKADIQKWMHAVRICIRNGYKITDANIWFDHMHLLEYFHKDTHSPKYVCPDDLLKVHARLSLKKDRAEMEKELQSRIKTIDKSEPKYQKLRGKYFGICFGNEDIIVTVITSVRGFFEEGSIMHHCVFSNRYYEKKDSLILSARDRNGNRLETVEVNTRTWMIEQSRGFMNNPSSAHDAIVELVEQNMDLFKRVA